jgi:hypothetical protein
VLNVKKIRGLNLTGAPWATLAFGGRPLGQNIFLRSVTSNILSLRSSLILKDQVLETFKTADKITRVSHNVLFSDVKREDKIFWTECCLLL